MANDTSNAAQNSQALVDNGMLTADTAALLPAQSTEDESALNEQATSEMAAQQAELAMLSKTRNGISNSSVDQALQAKRAQEDALQAETMQQEQIKDELGSEKATKEEQLRKALEAQAYSTSQGNSDPAIDAEITDLQASIQETNIALGQAMPEGEEVNTEADLTDSSQVEKRIQAEDASQLQEDTEIKKNSILNQMSDIQASMEAEEQNRQKLTDESNKIFSDIEELKKEAKDSQLDDFWSTSSTGTKILAALAIGIGAADAVQRGSGENQGMKMVNAIIDRQIAQKQQGFKNQLALKSAVLDKVKANLSILDSQTSSKVKKANILNIQGQLEAQQGALQQKLEMKQRQDSLQRLSSDDKLTSEQREVARVQFLSTLDPKAAEKAINLGDEGGIQVLGGVTPGEAQKLRDSVADSKQLQVDLTELDRLVGEVNVGEQLLSKVGIQTSDVRASEQLTNSIVGKLRLEILGPGVMTPAERELVKSIIGNPTELMTTDKIAKQMLSRLKHKIAQGTKDRLRISGAIIPKSKNEIQLDKLKTASRKDGIKFDRAKAMNFLIDKGMWQ